MTNAQLIETIDVGHLVVYAVFSPDDGGWYVDAVNLHMPSHSSMRGRLNGVPEKTLDDVPGMFASRDEAASAGVEAARKAGFAFKKVHVL